MLCCRAGLFLCTLCGELLSSGIYRAQWSARWSRLLVGASAPLGKGQAWSPLHHTMQLSLVQGGLQIRPSSQQCFHHCCWCNLQENSEWIFLIWHSAETVYLRLRVHSDCDVQIRKLESLFWWTAQASRNWWPQSAVIIQTSPRTVEPITEHPHLENVTPQAEKPAQQLVWLTAWWNF